MKRWMDWLHRVEEKSQVYLFCYPLERKVVDAVFPSIKIIKEGGTVDSKNM